MALRYTACRWSLRACRARWLTTSLPHARAALTMDTMNQNVRAMEYAVRGEVPTRAGQIEREIQEVRE